MRDVEKPVVPPSTIRLDGEEIALRKSFLDFTENDVRYLREIHHLLADYRDDFADTFYAHLQRYPATAAFLKDDRVLDRLKRSQSRYFEELTCGEYDAPYVENRLRIGVVHQRIGLVPKWYIGAYCKYLTELVPLLWKLYDGQAERFMPAYQALLKLVYFDMGLALDAYHQHDIEMVTQHKNYASDIVNRLSTGVIVISTSGEIRSINPAAARIFALPGYGSPSGASLGMLFPSTALERLVQEAIETGVEKRDVVIDVSIVGKGKRHLNICIAPTKLEESSVLALFIEDITDTLRAGAALKASEERFRMTFDQAAVGLAHLDMEGRICKANQKLCNILGYTSAEMLQMDIAQFVHPDDLKDVVKRAARMVHDGLSVYGDERRYRHKSGRYIWVSVNASSLREDPDGFRFILAVEDISQRKQAEEKLAFVASHDALTSLPNRILAEDRLSNSLIYARRARRYVAVMFVDLDRFKHINDSLGHGAGDTVIVEVARRLSAAVRTGDTVSRLGGDEFVVILADVAQEADIEPITHAILHAMYQPMRVNGHEIFVSASIGVAVYPKDAQDSASLLRYADIAMYRAKDFGRNNVQFYAEDMSARLQDRLRIEGALRYALERNEFLLHYQPQVDIATGKIVGVEALLRWQREDRQTISPSDFIHIAEETGLIVPIGEWVLRAACVQQATWRAAGMPRIRVSVNLSARQFRQTDFVEKIAGILAATHCEPSDLALEITESVLMEDPDTAAMVLRRLSEMGIHLAIDDFGTGYSSLSYLKRFPIDSLKIDRSFVQDISTDADDASIVQSVIALSHAMRLNVIAEGVETEEQLRFLREQACDQMQGYLVSKALPADALMRFVQEESCEVEAEVHPIGALSA